MHLRGGLFAEIFKRKFTICFYLWMALSACLAGCSFLRLSEEVNILNRSSILTGTVKTSAPSQQVPVVVLAYTKKRHNRKIVHFTRLHGPGPYELIVPQGRYRVFAFGDKNGNLVYDAGEPAGYHSFLVITGKGAMLRNLDVTLEKSQRASGDLPNGTAATDHLPGTVHSTLPGALADLDDKLFSYENGEKGYWQPYSFFREIGCNIYFLNSYDPSKIPVLFVHGAMGSPLGWQFFFQHMDLNRFQPWFFYYPSGASLQSTAEILCRKLMTLQTRYRFNKMIIAAHSMGGLVVRSVLVDYGGNLPFVSKFISISTPWAGVPMAVAGVKYSPVVLPSWKDLQPDGEFARSIFRKKLPDSVDHYLFFGYKDGKNGQWPNSDGVIGLTSQLEPRSQFQAAMVFGFNEDHTGILTSWSVLGLFNRILDEAWKDFSIRP